MLGKANTLPGFIRRNTAPNARGQVALCSTWGKGDSERLSLKGTQTNASAFRLAARQTDVYTTSYEEQRMLNLGKRSLGGILVVVYKHGRSRVASRQRDPLSMSPQGKQNSWAGKNAGHDRRTGPGVALSCVCFSEATRLPGGEVSSGVNQTESRPEQLRVCP